MEGVPLRKTNKKKVLFIKSLSVAIILSIIIGGLIIAIYKIPYFQQVKLNPTNENQLYYMGNAVNYIAIVEDDQLYLPIRFVKEFVDHSIEWDTNKKIAIITLNRGDNSKSEFTYPLTEYKEEYYLPVSPIDNFYKINAKHYEYNSIVLIDNRDQPIIKGVTLEQTKIRQYPRIMSPWLEEISQNQVVNIMKEINGRYWIENENGLLGYIDKDKVQISKAENVKLEKDVPYIPQPLEKPIVLTWEYASYKTANPKDINGLSGVKVVSPTWFHLSDDGLIVNRADIRYVNWAHNNNYQVWGLFSNSFDKDLTHKVLSNSLLRKKVIEQVKLYSDMYNLDGINIDFENVYLKDKDLLVEFVRDLTESLHETNLTVSIDVTVKANSPNWSLFYDRKRLGKIVDYVALMAYDEHWAASPVSGSVASMPWVEKGIKGLLEDVPNDKLLLGVPFYTRIWTESYNEDGKLEVESKTLTINHTKDWIVENNLEIKYDEASGQRYVELEKEGKTYKVWIEDDYSMRKRVNLMKKYNLAGLAAWRRGFETENIWSAISQSINVESN